MKKKYIDTGYKADEKGEKKILALESCRDCGGSGNIGTRLTYFANKALLQRNKPCYCGSGKKYKKCCGIRPKEALGIPQPCRCIKETKLNVNFVMV